VVFRAPGGFAAYKFIHLLFLGRSFGRQRPGLFGLRLGAFLGQPRAAVPPGTGKVAAALLATLHSYLRLSEAVLDFDPQAFLSAEAIVKDEFSYITFCMDVPAAFLQAMSCALHFLLGASFGAELGGRRPAAYRILSFGLDDVVTELALATDSVQRGA